MLAILPALVLAGIGVSAIWGETGLLVRHDLRQRLDSAKGDLAGLERDNQRLIRELSLLERDPIVMEREIAEELGWAREGTTLYRFVPESAEPAVRPTSAAPLPPEPSPAGGPLSADRR